MSFDRTALATAVARHGEVIRIVVAGISGSCPRETGAAMLVWANGQSGTIGGGALEWQATRNARRMTPANDRLDRIPLGPSLGQCCGGSVVLLSECYDAARLKTLAEDLVLRRVAGGAALPLKIKRTLSEHRNSGKIINPVLIEGWMLEPISSPHHPLWIYGAGHVGRALVDVLSPLPEFAITWVDISENRFPPLIAENVTRLVAHNPAEVVTYAPGNAQHLILTYSHALDLELCHQLLRHGFASAGLIGSNSKWARFRKRLRGLGHQDSQIDRIICPIGRPELGKHPQAIAVGVAGALLSQAGMEKIKKDMVG